MIPAAKPIIGEEEIAAVTEVLQSGQLAGGERVSRFEALFASEMDIPCAIATSSGTTALFAALWSLGLPPGAEVITTPFTFIASANAILYCGHNPVFCDIDERTFNISPDKLWKLLRSRKKPPVALIAVHLFGQPCQMDAIMDIAEEYGIKVIEDCAQSHGAAWQDKLAGNIGDIGVFSFYPTKNMTTGEGGMVVTKDHGLAEKIRMFINHGSRIRYRHELLGHNFRMTNIAASIGTVQLRHLSERNESRRRNAGVLDQILEKLPFIITPYCHPDARHAYNQYTIQCLYRDELAKFLEKEGISTGIHYPMPVHKQPLYQKLSCGKAQLPAAEKASLEVLSLPVHPSLSSEDLQYIGQKVGEFYESKGLRSHYNPQ